MNKATWIPSWYELDSSLELGLLDEFAFWKKIPENLAGHEALVFYNTLWKPKDAIISKGIISRIYHETMGEITKIDTRGLDYTIILENGKALCVNAEEEPGKIYEKIGGVSQASSLVVNNWVFSIEFSSLSEPKPA